MASKTLLVAQREYLENVRTKTFWISIFIVPLLIAASMGIGVLLKQFKQVQRYTVVDLGGEGLLERTEREFRKDDLTALVTWLGESDPAAVGETLAELKALAAEAQGGQPSNEQLAAVLEKLQRLPPEDIARIPDLGTSKKFDFVYPDELGVDESDPEATLKQLNEAVRDGELFAFFVLGEKPLETFDGFKYVSNNQTDDSLRRAYERTLTDLMQEDRIKDAGIKKSVAEHIQQKLTFEREKVSETGEAEEVKNTDVAEQWAPMGFVYLLFVSIFSIANLLLTNTIEEKSNRIIEVLLSSVSPAQLMHGKIYGIALTGLTIVGTWVVFALLASWLAPALLGETGGAISFLVAVLGNSSYLLSFVAYFLAGFLLYAAVLVAIGSVCNTLKEAQNLMQPVIIILTVPLIAMFFVTQEPNGNVAKLLSFIPIYTPFTMMNRAGGPPETWEYIATSALLLGTIWLAFKAAGKIFRVGVLMTGNPPKLREILGWLRQS